ncbi:MAG: tetratricopeptide repeat protein, partial [Bilifractor porci]
MQKWKAAAIAAVVLAVCFTGLFLFNQLPDQNVRRQIDKGNRYLESADYERAILAYQAAVEIDPQNIDAYLGLADSYRQQAGSYDEDETEKVIASYDHSAENYESAIRLDQDNIDPYLSLIQVYENAAECMDGIDESAKEEYQEKALEVAKRAARIDPSDEMVKSVIEKGAEDVADQAAEDE